MFFQTGSRTCCHFQCPGASCYGAQGVINDCYSYFRDRSLRTAGASRGSRSQSITLLLGPPGPQKGCDLMARVLVERLLGGEAW